MLKLNLGCGEQSMPGYVNVDIRDLPGVDKIVDFKSQSLPFDDDTVEEVYCSHCLEHVYPYKFFLNEITRVCRVGAKVEIRVPHWLSSMAMCNDHEHVVSVEQVLHWCEPKGTTANNYWWEGKKRFQFMTVEYVPSVYYQEAAKLFPHLNHSQLVQFIPNVCHESQFHLLVVHQDAEDRVHRIGSH